MNTNIYANGTSNTLVRSRLWSTEEPFSVRDLAKICEQQTQKSNYPHASFIEKNICVYDLSSFSFEDADVVERLKDEWNHILLSGPGVFVAKKLYPDSSIIETTNNVFQQIIASEAGKAHGDHFGAARNNSRIWNSFGKHCLRDPKSFSAYYSNPWLSHIFESWLGPSYRITAQVNIVRPGGAPQVSHRDYHLGFQTAEACAQFPKAMQVASQLLTLQGAVAHSDMPLSSGPTRFLPFSQMFPEGFMAYRRPEFNEYFLDHWVSLPLSMGDGVFFNPALFHAAGENRTSDVQRSANLLQISSAFGKAMEAIDTLPLIESCWAELKEMKGKNLEHQVKALIAAVADGYPFPTNLDRRPPAPGGMAPENEQQLLMRALDEDWNTEQVVTELKRMREASKAEGSGFV